METSQKGYHWGTDPHHDQADRYRAAKSRNSRSRVRFMTLLLLLALWFLVMKMNSDFGTNMLTSQVFWLC
jgi:hypothetical protein